MQGLRLATAFLVAIGLALPAAGATSAEAQVAARDGSLKIVRERRPPLLRTERVQTCLKELGLYDGRISGRPSASTTRALGRLMARQGIATAGDALKSRTVQAMLVTACKPALAEVDAERARSPEDSCGTFQRYSWSRKACICLEGLEKVDGICVRPPPARTAAKERQRDLAPAEAAGPPSPAAAIERPRANVTSAVAGPIETPSLPSAIPACLPAELKALVGRRPGQRGDVATCELPCIAPPPGPKADDPPPGISYCRNCVPFHAFLPLEDVLRIEAAGSVALCRAMPRSASDLETLLDPPLANLRSPRLLFGKGLAAEPHGNLAVVIGNQRYTVGSPAPHAHRDASAVYALLTEQLGYLHDNVIELKDASANDLERIFGSAANPKGELWQRLGSKVAAHNATLLVYFSGLGELRTGSGEAVLLPADAKSRRDPATGYPLQLLADNLVRLGAPATVLLEVDFNRDPRRLVFAPNTPETPGRLMAGAPKGPVVILAAADRDQRPLEDLEHGIGLFTRYVIEGLAGAADLAPGGNGDRAVDTVELFVFAAHRTGLAARKSFGVTQKPTTWQAQRGVLARLVEIKR
jgi:hypothetical protein